MLAEYVLFVLGTLWIGFDSCKPRVTCEIKDFLCEHFLQISEMLLLSLNLMKAYRLVHLKLEDPNPYQR